LLQKETPEIILRNCGLQIRQLWVQLITEYGKHCKRRRLQVTVLDEVKQRLRTE